MMSLPRILLCVLLASLIGCAPQRSVRVEPVDRPAPRSAPSGLYEVSRGDTLYGIAFRHGMDYRELASLNGIGPPYTIYPGQRLRLRAAAAARPAPREGSAGGVVTPIVSAPVRSTPPAASNPTGNAVTTPPAAPATPSPPVATAPPSTPPASAPPGAALPAGTPRWQWPSGGQIIGRYLAGDPTRQGINLAGSAGDPVRAAADGVVVYSGSGLIGYGELIIVKHNDTWLSAYGHNRKRLVGEGEAVRGGQQIAELGRTGTSRDMLHFEVRKNGKPIDPLGVLPAR